MDDILEDNRKLVSKFGASPASELKDVPDFYTFSKGLIFSHRDFDSFNSALKKGKKCAIVSGLNASGTFHIGHRVVFDTNLFFQKKFGIPVFVPISDDESYVTGKVKTQEEALENSMKLAKELLAYGFDPKRTFFIIDQIYTDIYNIAIRLSRRVTLSEIKASYGYRNEDNPGIYFYPAVQSAHVLFPQIMFGIENVAVPIGPDEDSHLRIARDIAGREGIPKPSVLHLSFLPGIDGSKMSKSKGNAIYLNDSPKAIVKKVNMAFSGGKETVELHRKYGGDPDVDVSILYLTKFFLGKEEGEKLVKGYRSGRILSGEVKEMLKRELIEFTGNFQRNFEKVKDSTVEKCILRNGKKVLL